MLNDNRTKHQHAVAVALLARRVAPGHGAKGVVVAVLPPRVAQRPMQLVTNKCGKHHAKDLGKAYRSTAKHGAGGQQTTDSRASEGRMACVITRGARTVCNRDSMTARIGNATARTRMAVPDGGVDA